MTTADADDGLPFPRRPNEILVPMGRLEDNNSKSFQEAITRSFTDYGLAWVDHLIEHVMPGTIVVPPLIASGYYGRYFAEFDQWRAARHFFELRAFQGVLIIGKPALASSWKLPNKDAISSWYGEKYQGNVVSILCIDDGLIRWTAGSFFHLIVTGLNPLEAFGSWLAGAEDRSKAEHGLSDELIGPSRDAFRKEAKALDFFFGPSLATAALANVVAYKSASAGELEWIWKYCESMTLHFLQAHEFGHYAFAAGSNPYFTDVRKLAAIITPPEADAELREEVFCDILGLENCCFQMETFQVPPVFAVFVPIWVLALVRGAASTRHESPVVLKKLKDALLTRMHAIALYWKHRNKLADLPAFGAAAHDALDPLTSLGLTVGEIAGRIDKE